MDCCWWHDSLQLFCFCFFCFLFVFLYIPFPSFSLLVICLLPLFRILFPLATEVIISIIFQHLTDNLFYRNFSFLIPPPPCFHLFLPLLLTLTPTHPPLFTHRRIRITL